MVWGQYSKTVISLLLVMGFKHVIHQMKGNIFLYPMIEDRIKMNVN